MTLFFPDLNVWLALSHAANSHHTDAARWHKLLARGDKLIFSRYTQIGLLRLLTSAAVMGDQVLKLREAWQVYDRWLEDPRVEFYLEPRGVDSTFREITRPLASQPASKAVGDCWLLAFAADIQATLVTFDSALYSLAKKRGLSSMIPALRAGE
jgi:toxin-antitoxin system PIN domain toxin